MPMVAAYVLSVSLVLSVLSVLSVMSEPLDGRKTNFKIILD